MCEITQRVYNILDEKGINYEKVEHTAVYTIDEMLAIGLPHSDRIAKNLFVRDDKKRNYYLFTVSEEKRADMKELRRRLGTRPLTFASEDDLGAIMGLQKGSVTPFGTLNDSEHKVQVYIDESFRGGLIGIHPNENTATVFMAADDLLNMLTDNGVKAEYFDF